MGDYDSSGALIQQAIWFGDLPVGLLVPVFRGKQLLYVEADALGTPRVVIDPARDVAVWNWNLANEAFGTTSPNQDPDSDGQAFVLDLRFAGQRYDSATGFNYNYFRDYDPSTGRYIESDPIGLNGGISTYGYVSGNSLTGTDPMGLAQPAMRVPGPQFTPRILLPPAANDPIYGFRNIPRIGLIGRAGGVGAAAVLGWGIGSAINYGIESTVGSPGEALFDMIHPESYSPDHSCPDSGNKSCPPCKTISGMIVPIGTMGYRPLDVIPDTKMQHGVYGSHHNLFKANQYPYPKCDCFWAKKKWVVKPDELQAGWVPVEPFAN